MKPLRFAIYAGTIWASGSLLLILVSLAEGSPTAWVELDLRPLTGIALLAGDLVGLGPRFGAIISYAEYGMPINPVNVVSALLLAFADGFASGYLLALIFNLFTGKLSTVKNTSAGFSVLTFGLSAGIVFGLCSGILAMLSVAYGLDIETFDFSVRPLFMTFMLVPEPGAGGFVHTAKRSYMIFPHGYTGVIAWTVWGFIDGFIGGAAGAYIYKKLSGKRGQN